MIVSILFIIGAFIWLGFETKWLTIRLVIDDRYEIPIEQAINILPLVMWAITLFIAVGFLPNEYSRRKWYLRYRLIRLLRRGIIKEIR